MPTAVAQVSRWLVCDVNIARPREGLQPTSGEGLGGLRPPKNKYFHSGVVQHSRMDD